MIPHSARKDCVRWIEEAVKNQARRVKACDVVGISIRTLQNWQKNGAVIADNRPTAVRQEPPNKLTALEREKIVNVCNEQQYANQARVYRYSLTKGLILPLNHRFIAFYMKQASSNTEGVPKPVKRLRSQPVTVLKMPIKSGPWISAICPQKSQDNFTICI